MLHVFALFAFCANGVVWAADESAQPVQVAQSQDATHLGDNRPATLGDIRHFEARMEDRMNRTDARIERLEDRMIQMFLALLAVMIALFGFPHLPDWWDRLRAGGKPAVIAGIVMFALALAGVVVAASI